MLAVTIIVIDNLLEDSRITNLRPFDTRDRMKVKVTVGLSISVDISSFEPILLALPSTQASQLIHQHIQILPSSVLAACRDKLEATKVHRSSEYLLNFLPLIWG